jgi:hypothetical protein
MNRVNRVEGGESGVSLGVCMPSDVPNVVPGGGMVRLPCVSSSSVLRQM